MLPVALDEFELFFSFHYNCQLVKGQLYKKNLQLPNPPPPLPPPHSLRPPGFYGPRRTLE